MTEYPKEIDFKYTWRKYQQRVLDDLEKHLTDRHLHLIAPPGSGKTVLGLAVAIKLNRPTLILAPTLAIRNQWIQRFCELFLQTTDPPDWISRDIRNPKFLTVVTYQGLHAACNDQKITEEELHEAEEEEVEIVEKTSNSNLDNIARGLQSQNIKTIVVDEAHHLKNEWWQTLSKIKDKLDPVIVGLTATPPYDVTATEWQRYIALNGSVDTEISVPELIMAGDLCPHQDYVHFTFPTEKESESISEFRDKIEELFLDVRQDKTIVEAIMQHPIWQNPTEHFEWIYGNLSWYSACLIYLNANGVPISETHLEVIGDKDFEIPELDYKWMETVIDFYLYREKTHFLEFEEHQLKLESKLRRHGAIENKQINFFYNRQVNKYLISSISKLNGIQEIVDFEYKQLGKKLRMVILSDFIRKEYFVNTSENTLELSKIGIIPIFEKLRRENSDNKKIGVLTGSIIIIPKSALLAFELKAREVGITQVTTSEVPYDANYIVIHQNEKLKNDVIYIVTQIFQEGEIEVLIGTKSLLGEGWDAPAINSLILASFVGSFVLSNQMRGRAIRTQNGNKDKTSNIWHLVTVDKTSLTGGNDFEILKRRFRSFVGVSFKEDAGIENGIGRLNLSANIDIEDEAEKKNAEMFEFAADRESLIQRWKTALDTGFTLVEEIKIPFREEKEYTAQKTFYLKKTIGNLSGTLASGLLFFGIENLQGLLRALLKMKTVSDIYIFLAFMSITGIAIFGRLSIKTLRLYIKYRDISKDIQKIGEALLLSLNKAGTIHTSLSQLQVQSAVNNSGAVFCHLDGGTTFEKSTFINALREIVIPIDNPRYVMVRKSRSMLFVKQQDYHSVPEILGRNKNLAEHFESNWRNLVGKCELIFCRTIEGRKLLLKSRLQSLSAQLEENVEHISKWR